MHQRRVMTIMKWSSSMRTLQTETEMTKLAKTLGQSLSCNRETNGRGLKLLKIFFPHASLEAPQGYASNENTQHVFSWGQTGPSKR